VGGTPVDDQGGQQQRPAAGDDRHGGAQRATCARGVAEERAGRRPARSAIRAISGAATAAPSTEQVNAKPPTTSDPDKRAPTATPVVTPAPPNS